MTGPTGSQGRASDAPAAVHLVGVGPGPVDLLTVRASRLLALSGTCLYAHGQVPRESLSLVSPTAKVVDTTDLTEHQILGEVRAALARNDRVVVLFAGDPGQHAEAAQLSSMFAADGISSELVPGIGHPDFGPSSGAQGADGQSPAATSGGPVVSAPSGRRAGGASPGLILVLGGTSEARELANLLVTAGLEVVTALAGKVARPRMPRGEVRIGEFGGAPGLTHWLRENAVNAVIDATDPFSERISSDAIEATAATGLPLLRLQRTPWSETDGDEWIRVPDMQAAVAVVMKRFRRPMLTVGKLGASEFADDSRGSYLIRCSEPPPGPLPHRYLLVLDRGPFGVESERTLMARHRIDVLVTRDSGGQTSEAKLEAARALHIPVVMVERPNGDASVEGARALETVHSVSDAARWLVARFGSRVAAD